MDPLLPIVEELKDDRTVVVDTLAMESDPIISVKVSADKNKGKGKGKAAEQKVRQIS